ncbi:MAG: helicase C-terminal domain-containing protein [Candidatus Helarchaeota archaeon]
MIHELKDEIRPYFPYENERQEQGSTINRIYEVIQKSGNHVVISAPNGYGKTILSLAPLLPIIKSKNKRLIYLCRTHTQVQRVIEELSKIDAKLKRNNMDIEIGGLGLRGRNAMCFHPVVLKLKDPNLAQLTCSELRKGNRCMFYSNIKKKTERVDFLLSILKITPMDGSQLIETCKDYALCPYMISKLALSNVDLIACNYQWILNPYIRKGFLETLDISLKDVILVIDEAHNIPNVATEIASLTLTKYSVDMLINEIYEFKKKDLLEFGKALQEIFKNFLKRNFTEIEIIPEYIIKNLRLKSGINEQFFKRMIDIGLEIKNTKIKRKATPQSFIHSIGRFFLHWINSMEKDSFIFIASKYKTRKNQDTVKMEIISLDPRDTLKEILNEVDNSLHMSGTIIPDAYIDTIGLPESTVIINLPALWKENNLKVIALKGITSKGSSRSIGMYKQMLEHIKIAIECTPKNIGIFTASYDILNGLIKAGFENIKTKKKIFIEKSHMTSKDNDQLIMAFKGASKNEGGVLLGVCGGRNAEGEDFPGDFMNTVIVCGIPFARPTIRTQALIKYYVKYWGEKKGRDIAYNVPALRRANQAAGRPIRTLDDRGVIILMDYRYATSYFKKFLADWIKDRIIVLDNDPEQLKHELFLFYGNK